MQEIIVFVIVAGAAWVVTQRYGPAPVRAWLAGTRTKVAHRFGIATRARQGAGSCGGCEGCANTPGPDAAASNKITPEQLKKTIPRS